jgi:hypothetical protein
MQSSAIERRRKTTKTLRGGVLLFALMENYGFERSKEFNLENNMQCGIRKTCGFPLLHIVLHSNVMVQVFPFIQLHLTILMLQNKSGLWFHYNIYLFL